MKRAGALSPSHVWLLILVNLGGIIAALALGSSAPGLALALWIAPDFLLAYHVFAPGAQGLGRMHRRFQPSGREVWLTIDDGPDPTDTPQLLTLLAATSARATFFVIGENAARHPELIRQITAAGHEVANHTYTHPLASFWCASPGRTARELDRAREVLRAAGVDPTRFRPPAGIKNLWLASALSSRRLTAIGWSARGLERRSADAAVVAERVLRNVQPGSILLLHEGPRVPAAIRVEAIRLVLERLHIDGYRCIVPTAAQLTARTA